MHKLRARLGGSASLLAFAPASSSAYLFRTHVSERYGGLRLLRHIGYRLPRPAATLAMEVGDRRGAVRLVAAIAEVKCACAAAGYDPFWAAL
jgi:hypothetical protein